MTQIQTRLETFTDLALLAGLTKFNGWYVAKPQAAAHQDCQLFDGYLGSHGGASAVAGSPLLAFPCGLFLRRLNKLNQRYNLSSQVGAESGGILDNSLLEAGILGRIQGGGAVINAGTPEEGLRDLTCYEAVYESTGGNNYRYRISRWNSGVETVLGTTSPEALYVGKHRNPFLITAQFATFGTVIQIRLWAQFINDNVPVNVLTVSESTAVGITPNGAGGIKCTGDRTVSGSDTIHLLNYFEVYTSDDFITDPSGSLVWREEWERSSGRVSQSFTDSHGTTGRSLHAFYSCDASGRLPQDASGPNASDRLQITRDVANVSGCAELFGSGDFLELEDPAFTWVGLGGASVRHQFTVAVWVELRSNRDGNELWANEDTGGGNLQEVFLWGLRVAPDIGGQAAARFELRVRTASGSPGLTSYTSTDFVIADRLDEVFCYAMTYEEGYFTNGANRVRFWIGRHGDMDLIDTVTVAAAHTQRFGTGNQVRIGERTNHVGPDIETYLFGRINRVDFFGRQDKSNVPGGDVVTEWQMDAVGDERIDDWIRSATDPGLSGRLSWNEGWRFEDFTWQGGINYYHSKRNPGDNRSSFRDTNGATELDGQLPNLPEAQTAGWTARVQKVGEGQYREATFNLPGEFDRCGIWVRSAIMPPIGGGQGDDGYKVEVGVGAPAPIKVYRVIAGAETIIARQHPDTGTRNVTLSTDFALAAEAYTLPGTGPDGPVAIKVWLDTLAVPLERWGDAEHTPDVSVGLGGEVVDHSSLRLDGTNTHVAFYGAALTTTPVEVDDWDGTDTPTVGGDDVADTPGIVVPTESASAAGNLSDGIDPGWQMAIRETGYRKERQMESGRYKRAVMTTAGRRVVDVLKRGATDAELSDLFSFWQSHNGAEVPFTANLGTWIRGETSGTYAFVEDSLQLGAAGNHWTTSFQIEEVK